MVSIEVDPRDGVDGGGSSWMDVVGVVCCWSAERCWGVTGGDACGGVEDGIWRCTW